MATDFIEACIGGKMKTLILKAEVNATLCMPKVAEELLRGWECKAIAYGCTNWTKKYH